MKEKTYKDQATPTDPRNTQIEKHCTFIDDELVDNSEIHNSSVSEMDFEDGWT